MRMALLLLLCSACALANPASVLVVVGAPGEPEYGSAFTEWAGHWERAAQQAGAEFAAIGLAPEGGQPDREALQAALASAAKETDSELWLVLIGHGTWDGRSANFNLRGPDASATELAKWLEPIRRPVAVINLASASGPFLKVLSAKGRVVVTATRSGDEEQFARLGAHLSAAIADPAADLDKDGQTSLLEAWLSGAHATRAFYEREGRLATEHPLLDDNDDGLGTPPDFFEGVVPVRKAAGDAELDGLRARQLVLVRSAAERAIPDGLRAERDALELRIEQLRGKKEALGEVEYYGQLEPLMLALARLYAKLPPAPAQSQVPPARGRE